MRSLHSLRPGVHARLRSTQRSVLLRARFVSSTPQRRSNEASSPQTEPASASSKGKEKETAPAAEASQGAAQDGLPLLQRPLGVKEKPKARVKAWSDTKEKFMDQDKRMEERTHLYVVVLALSTICASSTAY